MQKGKLGAKHFYPHIVWQKSGQGMRSSRTGRKKPPPVEVSAHYRQNTHRYPLLVSAYSHHGPRTTAHGPQCMQRASHTTASGSHTRTMAGSLGQLVADHVRQLGGPRPTINGQLRAGRYKCALVIIRTRSARWARLTASGPRPTVPAARWPVDFGRPTERGPWPDSVHWARRY
jgi:hypothetical protein